MRSVQLPPPSAIPQAAAATAAAQLPLLTPAHPLSRLPPPDLCAAAAMIKPPPAGPIVAGVAFTTVWIMAFDKTPIDSLKSTLEGVAAV